MYLKIKKGVRVWVWRQILPLVFKNDHLIASCPCKSCCIFRKAWNNISEGLKL